jgi:hypothetical protein
MRENVTERNNHHIDTRTAAYNKPVCKHIYKNKNVIVNRHICCFEGQKKEAK